MVSLMNEREIWSKNKKVENNVLRGDGLLENVLEERMLVKRPRGRPRIGMINDLMEGSFEKWREELREEKIGGGGCLGAAWRQKTNDDDDDYCWSTSTVHDWSLIRINCSKDHRSSTAFLLV